MITSEQLRAGRALLRWSAKDLSAASGIGTATIQRLDVMKGIPAGTLKTLQSLKQALENAGVEFTGTDQHKPGVCLDLEKHAAYMEASDHGRG